MQFSPKQREYWDAPYHRWNFKYGAVRSGKTYLDYYLIPRRIRERAGKSGLVVLMGNTRGTLRRNVLQPMRELYGEALVPEMRTDGTMRLFGETVYCLGADSRGQVDRLRGASIKYCYGDEVATWSEDVFEMLKSRLDKPWSCFDGTCNPEGPDHWLKRFLDSDADIFAQRYTLDDNPFLPEGVREALKREHKGVFYERHVLGRWVTAKGLVFPYFAEDPRRFLAAPEDFASPFLRVTIGVDFGGHLSQTHFTAVGFREGYRSLVVLDEAALPVRAAIDAAAIAQAFVAFAGKVLARWGRVDHVFCDSASPTLINTLVSAARSSRGGFNWRKIGPCAKTPGVSQRPLTVDRLLCCGRMRIAPGCGDLIRALSSLRWDERRPDQPEDRNEGNINDAWDAFCYAWTTFAPYIDRQA